MLEPFAHLSQRVSGHVLRAGDVYHGGVLVADAGGAATVAVYDGVDATGELVDHFAAAAGGADRHALDGGIRLRYGLYVDTGANVAAFTVFYTPPPAVAG